MKRSQKQILIIGIISIFIAAVLFIPNLTKAEKKPNPNDSIMTMLEEIYSIVLDTNFKLGVPAPVEKTGQNLCWNSDGNAIGCEGTGQDGELQKGVAWPNPRFTDNADGTVTDHLTGLIWLKNANCFGQKYWAPALNDCNSLNSGECDLSDGSSEGDWRLPNVRELHSLVDYGMNGPALPSGHPFENAQSYDYWSSTYITGNTIGAAWSVSFFQGDVNSTATNNNGYVWPVRGGK